MQGKHWLVVCMLVLAGCDWKVRNEHYCARGEQCPPVDIPCNSSGECEAPTPVCNEERMICVECTINDHCRVEAPTCDLDTGKCVQCTKHADCASDLCLDNQTCADAAEVLHVSATGVDNPSCSKGMPCKLLKQALVSAELRKYIRVKGTISDTAETVIDGNMIGKPIFIHGDPGTSILTRSDTGFVLSITKSAEVTLADLEIKATTTVATSDGVEIKDMPGPMVKMIRTKLSGHSGKGALLTAGSLTLMRSQVVENRTYGIDVSGGTLTLEGSWVYGNSGESAIRVTGTSSMVTISSSVIAGNGGTSGGLDIASTFSITNTVIAGNGKALTGTVGGARLQASSGTFMFNTVADNIAAAGTSNGIVCGGTTRTISNSIVKNNAIDVTCTGVTYSLTDVALPAGNNITGDPKFTTTRNPLDLTFYRIGPESAARDKGEANTPIMFDIDGQARDDGMKDIGADEYREP